MTLTEPLKWDSDFFGFPIGRVLSDADDLAAAAAEADARGYVCMYLLLDAARSGALIDAQRAGFVVVGTRVELAAASLGEAPEPSGGLVRRADPTADGDWIAALARDRFTTTRFYTDPGFGASAAGRLYVEWVKTALDDQQRELIVLDDCSGFVVCATDANRSEGVIELIATTGGKRGVGKELMAAAHACITDQGLDRSSVVTQGDNIPALRLYERSGYRTRDYGTWLHRWSGDPEKPAVDQ